MEECNFHHFPRLALVVGIRAFKWRLEKSSARVGVGWPHLSGTTAHETKDFLVDFSREKTSIGRMRTTCNDEFE
jgi:hypothetical protein